jgi:hypothetical protein
MPNIDKPGEVGVLTSIFRFFRSIKTAVTLLLIITALSILATLVPQGRDAAYYQSAYGTGPAKGIIGLNFDTFFSSFLFIFPTFLFCINLGVCTVDRFVGRLRRKMKKRFGPDILHAGLLILVVGGIITFSGRREGVTSLLEGETASFPGGYTVTLTSFEFLTYADGVPKDWISTVRVAKDGDTVIETFDIEVNRPLKIGNVKLYQSSYFVEDSLTVRDAAGTDYHVKKDSLIPAGDEALIFRGMESPAGSNKVAILDAWKDHEITGTVRMEIGDSIGKFTITEIHNRMATGLRAVIDPGYRIVFVALLIVITGLGLTYIQKIGDT